MSVCTVCGKPYGECDARQPPEATRAALTDDVMRQVLIVLPPPADFAAYADAVRERLLDHLEGVHDAIREAASAYLWAEAAPAYSWVIESQMSRAEGRPNREVDRMDRIARARHALRAALLTGGVTDGASSDYGGLPSEPTERGLIESGFDVASNGSQADSGLVLVEGRQVDDDLDVASEDRERSFGHADTVQHTVSNVNRDDSES